jgi:N-acetylglucosaminyldiphosphoundecaprenol N-acetyl-beta-D-mannosaminyltransferase
VIERVVDLVRVRWPGVRVAGFRNGYYHAEDEPQIAHAIGASYADLLLVGITSPKKELFISRWGAALHVPVCHGVGGSFDVLAGKVRRAPPGWQRLGLEWAFRALQEPRRLGPRYVATNSVFFGLVAAELLRQRISAGA